MKYILPLLFFVLVSGCKKDENLTAHPELLGDFDWTHTYVDSEKLLTKENSGTSYGLRFFKNGKVFSYKNGKLDRKGFLQDVNPYENGKLLVTVKLKDGPKIDLIYLNNQMIARKYPYGELDLATEMVNVFQKK